MRLLNWVFFSLLGTITANGADLNQYSIPVSESLRPWATFTIKEAHLRVRKGRAHLEYALPAELAADGLKLEADGKFYDFEKPILLTGKLIKSCTCTINGDLARCELKYAPELPALSAEGRLATETLLKATVTNPEELERRLAVLDEFINGPAESITDSHEAGGFFERLKVRYR